jgi:hypothetical protein
LVVGSGEQDMYCQVVFTCWENVGWNSGYFILLFLDKSTNQTGCWIGTWKSKQSLGTKRQGTKRHFGLDCYFVFCSTLDPSDKKKYVYEHHKISYETSCTWFALLQVSLFMVTSKICVALVRNQTLKVRPFKLFLATKGPISSIGKILVLFPLPKKCAVFYPKLCILNFPALAHCSAVRVSWL